MDGKNVRHLKRRVPSKVGIKMRNILLQKKRRVITLNPVQKMKQSEFQMLKKMDCFKSGQGLEEVNTESLTTMYLLPTEEEQQDSLATDLLAGCEKRDEKKPLVAVKSEEAKDGVSADELDFASKRLISIKAVNAGDMKDVSSREFGSGSVDSRCNTTKSPFERSRATKPNQAAEEWFQCKCEKNCTCPSLFTCYKCEELCVSCERNHAVRYSCNVCGTRFAHRHLVIPHMRVHNDDELLSCEVCNDSFLQADRLAQHMRLHSDKAFECSDCSKTFASRDELELHSESHPARLRFTCNACQQYFSHPEALLNHLKQSCARKQEM